MPFNVMIRRRRIVAVMAFASLVADLALNTLVVNMNTRAAAPLTRFR